MILDCGHEPSPHGEYTTGYGSDSNGKTSCYECCGVLDRKAMKESGRGVLYDCGKTVTNWPSTLSYKVRERRTGRHNLAGTRYDLYWYDEEGRSWWGVRYGDMTQVVHAKRLKLPHGWHSGDVSFSRGLAYRGED
jgi:hypothetical protein